MEVNCGQIRWTELNRSSDSVRQKRGFDCGENCYLKSVCYSVVFDFFSFMVGGSVASAVSVMLVLTLFQHDSGYECRFKELLIIG
jgi:hypothetical protein